MSDEEFERLRRINEQIKESAASQPISIIEDQIEEPAEASEEIPEEKPSNGLYVGMMMLSIFVGLAGLIVGIIYVTKKNKHYQTLGIIMMVISVVCLLYTGGIACCIISAFTNGF